MRNATVEDEKLFKAGMDPLINAERLGALLMEFPMSFQNTPDNRQHVTRQCCKDYMAATLVA